MKIGNKIMIIASVAALVALLGGFLGFAIWVDQQPKFQSVTIELGEEMPELTAFYTQYTAPEVVKPVTDLGSLDLSAAGEHQLTFTHGKREETVTLTVVDTVAPVAVFQDRVVHIDTQPKPEDFVKEASDLAQITITFAKPLTTPETYGDEMVEIVVTDASGNAVTGQCKLSYVWMIDAYTLELGQTLEKSHLLMNAEKDGDLIDQAVLDTINAGGVGTYEVTTTTAGKTCTCTVSVVDTVAPELELKAVQLYKGQQASLEDFVVSATDVSGEVQVRLVTDLKFSDFGSYTVVVEAQDINGNITTKETKLEIVRDTTGPAISGLSAMQVQKHSNPDFMKGVSAYDAKDGAVTVTCDASRADLTKAGTYYITYTAVDNSGNKTTSRRKITVEHDWEDTAALVSSIAAKLSSDPEKIRDYVRNSIGYSSSWGGSDPVWYGFKNKSGNCYVHALCLQALLREKGYTTKLIWVTDKSHYWNLIYINGVWRHIDATPGSRHTKYSLMTDAQRYEILQGRDWDRTQWPACE